MSAVTPGGPAFPGGMGNGMSLRDYFAAKAPTASTDWMAMRRICERNLNPHNDSYKPRLHSDTELRAMWTFEWADAMLKAREA